VVELPGELYDEIVAHALEGWPEEVCGVIAGEAGAPVRAHRIANRHKTPRTRYDLDPETLMSTVLEMESSGRELYGIYHSHPSSEPYPSATDRELAFLPQPDASGHRLPAWPGAIYFICGLEDRARPRLRAFRIHEDGVEELELRRADTAPAAL
jgi:proteasome lid subunit RPN8/RPN11